MSWTLVVLAAALAVSALWLAVDNPAISGTSRGAEYGGDYTCLAPYDTVLNDADNYPGGEPPPDGDEIAARCRSAGEERFDQAVIAGSAAAVVGVLTAIVEWRSRRRTGSVSLFREHDRAAGRPQVFSRCSPR